MNNISNNSNMEDVDRDKKMWKSIIKGRETKFTSLIGGIVVAFLLGWLFLIPAIAVLLVAYGGIVYFKERKNRITVTMKPTAAMEVIARREAQLQKEKGSIMYEYESKVTR